MFVHRRKKFSKVFRTVQELAIQAFTKQSSGKFTELFRMKCATVPYFILKSSVNFPGVCVI